MNTQDQLNYERIAQAIEYIRAHFKEQPGLDEVAAQVHMSPFHFQRMFSDWAGISPKKFLQYTSVSYARQLLKEANASIIDAALETGLSGTSRLHDLFINIEGMTPAEYRDGGKNLSIHYSFAESPFGNILIASTQKGICYMAFYEEEQVALGLLREQFPNAAYTHKLDLVQQNALFIFQHDWQKLNQVKLHLKGSAFQLKIWETLLKIPMGKLATYGAIAQQIQQPNAARAVGTAIGSNPVAYLIPCHRVIKAFVLIHGSWHSAWNWHLVTPLLENMGHTVYAIDLPGMGRDKTPIQEVRMENTVHRLCELVDSIEGTVILVGHSKNGIMISQVAEQRPGKIEKLIYLAAYLVPNGKTQAAYSAQDVNGVLKPYVTRHPETNSHSLQTEIYKEGLYHDCEPYIVSLAKLLLSQEPVESGITPLVLTEEKFGSVRRFYIECTEDRAVTPFIQQKMYTETPCEKVYRIKSSHSPFFSQPEELCSIFAEIAGA